MTRKEVMARELGVWEAFARWEERRKRQIEALKKALRRMSWERGYQRWRANECAAMLAEGRPPLPTQGGNLA